IAAECADVSYEEIKGLNPELSQWITPPHISNYEMKIPHGTLKKFKPRYAALTPAEKVAATVHEVKGKESLTQIASRYRIPVKFLAAVNQRASNGRLVAGQSILIPKEPPEGERFRDPVFKEKRNRSRRAVGDLVAYRVRSGDSLYRISKKLGVSRSALQRLNPDISWERLQKGSVIQLSPRKLKIKKSNRTQNRPQSEV
ncbi:MAG: LysM peptidoglycan-binding domain-containing protein, partial [Deltaproteobacteria bacterium]|nr:LysM peptidoglycan-binding domain-containing protein [Deltaproteobacteria bacterium]